MPLVLTSVPTVYSLMARESCSPSPLSPVSSVSWRLGGQLLATVDAVPLIWAEDEEVDDDDDLAESEAVPAAEPLEPASDFDEDDFDDEFDDDFEEEFDEDEFGVEVTPEDLDSGDDDEPFDADDD